MLKSGPRKPRLEALTLCQWSIANLSILYKFVGDGKLHGAAMMDYLSYTTKVYQLVQRFSLVSVFQYDREYRKMQAEMGFRWGTDVQHLHTLCLQPRERQLAQNGKKGQSLSSLPKDRVDKREGETVCRSFNTEKGCSFRNCKYKHQCILPGCNQRHTVQTHMQAKN